MTRISQRGIIPINLLVYAGIFLVVSAVIGTAYTKIKDAGRDEIRAEWAEANAAAQKKADEDRKAVEALREAQDKETSRRLANARKRNQELLGSLEAHIKADKSAACPVSDGLRDLWNRANNPGEGVGSSTVPPTGRTPAPSN